MATYLVDYENRNQKGLYNGLSGVDKLEATDNVYVFLGSISKVPYHVLNACINESKASITFKKCEKSGDNYLDFQLGTLLGNLIASTDEKLYYIVTEDNDFLALSDFWARENIGVQIIKQPVVKFVPEMFQLGANTNSFVTGNTNGNSNGNNSNNSSNNNGNNNNSRRGRDNRPTSKK
ncbi:MAG: hypothetical protein LBN22_11180, partial [Clostridiales Family XIII bacterium]|nr:hypothetical protein [Clostridiales Family XIII bacterium]